MVCRISGTEHAAAIAAALCGALNAAEAGTELADALRELAERGHA